jgi:O-antigen ligase
MKQAILSYRLNMGHVILWVIALAAPCAIVSIQAPITITPIRVVSVIAGVAVLLVWLIRGVIRLSHNELLFFFVALMVSTGSVIQSSERLDQAFFFWLSAAMFMLVYIVSSHYSRAYSMSIQKLTNLLIAPGVIYALIGIADWVYGFIYGQSLWKMLLNYPSDSSFDSAFVVGSLIIPRSSGLFSDANLFAYYLLMPSLLLIARFSEKQKGQGLSSVLHFLALFVVLMAVVLSMSRSGIAALFAAALILSVKYHRVRWYVISLLFGGVLAGLFMVTVSDYPNVLGVIVEQRLELEGDVADMVGGNRLARMQAGLEAFVASPVFGVGIGDIGPYLQNNTANSEIVTSHSFYLDVLAGMGLIGFSVLVTGMMFYLWRSWSAAKGSPACFAAVTAVMGIFAVQLVYRNLLEPALAFQIGIAASLCRKNIAHRNKQNGEIVRPASGL